MKKIKRNEKCPCKSGKKYKTCCFQNISENKFTKNNPNPTTKIQNYKEYLKHTYPKHPVIDISHNLDHSNYKNYHMCNLTSKNILIAEKNEKNKKIFIEKGYFTADIIILYRTACLCFEDQQFEVAKNKIREMIYGHSNQICKLCQKETNKITTCASCQQTICFICAENILTDKNSEITPEGLFIDCPICKTKSSIHISSPK